MRLYNSRRWRKLRRNVLTRRPLCVMCSEHGRTTAATEVDHIEKHNGDPVKFWDRNNLQPLCAFHHRSVKARIERSGMYGCDSTGTPHDPAHHWNT